MYILQSKPARPMFASTDKIYYNEDSKWEFIKDKSQATKYETKEEAEKIKQKLLESDPAPIKIVKTK